MARKRELHFSMEARYQILKTIGGVLPNDCMLLNQALDQLTFVQLDNLVRALNIIRKGEHEWRKP